MSMTEERVTPTQIEIPKWTAQQFERLVLDCNPKVAVFDCDGTLWSGDAGYEFMVWSLEQALVSRSTSDWIDTRHRAYRAGHVSELQICGEMVQMYSGLRDHEMRAAAAQYVQEFVRARVFAELVSLIAALGQAGVEIWAVSSTNRWVVAEGVAISAFSKIMCWQRKFVWPTASLPAKLWMCPRTKAGRHSKKDWIAKPRCVSETPFFKA